MPAKKTNDEVLQPTNNASASTEGQVAGGARDSSVNVVDELQVASSKPTAFSGEIVRGTHQDPSVEEKEEDPNFISSITLSSTILYNFNKLDGRQVGGAGRFGARRDKKTRNKGKISFDYKNPDSLLPYLTLGCKILPSRLTNLSKQEQNDLKTAVKRARQLALLRYTVLHKK